MNEKIDELIKFFNLNEVDGQYEIIGESGEVQLFSKNQLREKVRKILGIDKQCFQCLEYFFQHDLSVVEETGQLICQDCAEGILNGTIKVREEV